MMILPSQRRSKKVSSQQILETALRQQDNRIKHEFLI